MRFTVKFYAIIVASLYGSTVAFSDILGCKTHKSRQDVNKVKGAGLTPISPQ